MPVPGRLAMTIAVLFQAVRSEVGVAHLLEHWVFKGTEHDRTASELNRAVEYLGNRA
jgi:predicted Zn-dependent peptidase